MARNFQWRGTTVPFPTTLSWANHDISTENSGRSKSGKMHKRNVAVKRELNASWIMVPDSQSASVLGTIKGNVFGTLKYPDPQAGEDVTKTFYTGDPDAELKFKDGDTCYWNISISFVEQ